MLKRVAAINFKHKYIIYIHVLKNETAKNIPVGLAAAAAVCLIFDSVDNQNINYLSVTCFFMTESI